MNTIINWLTTACNLSAYTEQPLAGDASFRRYIRVHCHDQSYIAMDASREKSSCEPFILIAKKLRAAGLQVPEILSYDLDAGFILLTDFGDQLYLHTLNINNANELYGIALTALVKMQQLPADKNGQLPLFTVEFMQQELQLCREWFLDKYLQLPLVDSEYKILTRTFDLLTTTIDLQPKAFMHRDYHSANLMVLPHNQVGILDFQDAFIGPVIYDLVSLLRDCYIDFSDEIIYPLALHFRDQTKIKASKEEFIRWFDWMGMQRHLKALLTFARKFIRDHNTNYLSHIPRTVTYISKVADKYDEFKDFSLLWNRVEDRIICAR